MINFLEAEKKGVAGDVKMFVRVCREQEIPFREGKRIELDNDDIALWRVGSALRAFSNICPHNRISCLHRGVIENGEIECPEHGWKFSADTGAMQQRSVKLSVYEVLVERGWVWVEKPQEQDFSAW